MTIRNGNDDEMSFRDIMILAAVVILVILLLLALITGVWVGVKVIHRNQRLADARNDVTIAQVKARNQIKLNEIDIASQGQRVRVAIQKAEIRFQDARGVREAQDEIAKTLTPLYVQFEMVDALKTIAQSGRNNTVVYIPSGANGIPLVSAVAGQPSVTGR